jgi:Spy/CpxP family protein refolding chaperone
MHPFKAWRFARRALAGCGEHGTWGRGCGPHSPDYAEMEGFDEDFGSFGVRRPLRFLAHKLNLDQRQVAELARILDDLKTERIQAAVDRRRTVAAFADALTADAFDAARAAEAGELRVQSATRLRDAVLTALQRIHAVLNAEQRVEFAYLVRTGTLLI